MELAVGLIFGSILFVGLMINGTLAEIRDILRDIRNYRRDG